MIASVITAYKKWGRHEVFINYFFFITDYCLFFDHKAGFFGRSAPPLLFLLDTYYGYHSFILSSFFLWVENFLTSNFRFFDFFFLLEYFTSCFFFSRLVLNFFAANFSNKLHWDGFLLSLSTAFFFSFFFFVFLQHQLFQQYQMDADIVR